MGKIIIDQYTNMDLSPKRKWQLRHPDQAKKLIKTSYKKYYLKNKEKLCKYQQKYYKENRGKILEKKEKYFLNNKDRIQQYNRMNINRKRKWEIKNRVKLRIEVIQLLGGKCANPYNIEHGGFMNDTRCLQIDHIYGGGNKEAKELGSRGILYKVLKDSNHKLKYQLLCANCNWIKKVINNENSKPLYKNS